MFSLAHALSGFSPATRPMLAEPVARPVSEMSIQPATGKLQELLRGQTGINALLSSFSHWLEEYIPLAVLAFGNPRNQKFYLIFSEKHPDHGKLPQLALEILEGPSPIIRHWRQNYWSFHYWSGAPLDKGERILLIESGCNIPLDEINHILQEGLRILKPYLKADG